MAVSRDTRLLVVRCPAVQQAPGAHLKFVRTFVSLRTPSCPMSTCTPAPPPRLKPLTGCVRLHVLVDSQPNVDMVDQFARMDRVTLSCSVVTSLVQRTHMDNRMIHSNMACHNRKTSRSSHHRIMFFTSDRGRLFEREPARFVPLELSLGANVQCSTTSRSSVERAFVGTLMGFM